MSNERPTYPIGINVFVVRDGKLLLGKRKNTAGHGTWGLPGGHLELGESMIAAGLRELKEETGLCSTDLKFLNLVNDRSGDTHYVQIGFLVDRVDGEPQLMEPEKCFEWQWFDVSDIDLDNVFHGHKKQIENFLEHRLFIDG